MNNKQEGQEHGYQDEDEWEVVVKALEERLEEHDESRKAVQAELSEFCDGLRRWVNEVERKINSELSVKFEEEDGRLQCALNSVRELSRGDSHGEALSKAVRKARAELLVAQSYELKRGAVPDASRVCELSTTKELRGEWIDLERVNDFCTAEVESGRVVLRTGGVSDEWRMLTEGGFDHLVKLTASLHRRGCGDVGEYPLTKGSDASGLLFAIVPDTLEAGTPYSLKTKSRYKGRESSWRSGIEFTTPEFKKCCVWRECPDWIGNERRMYSVCKSSRRVATKAREYGNCTITANTPIPLGATTSWNIRILRSKRGDGEYVYAGAAPSDIDQNEDENFRKCGWYLNCHTMTLRSGPPHNHRNKAYGVGGEDDGEHVHTGDSVGVAMDTAHGELSFALNGVDLGVAYEGIPLDKPLVPCVVLYNVEDSVELCPWEMGAGPSSFVLAPSSILTESNTWDSITLVWAAAEGASFYQIEVDGNKFWDTSKTSTFTKRGLRPETEHSFRVRAVRGNSVSEWSGAVKGRTQKELFGASWWRECPNNIDWYKKYYVDKSNPRVATNSIGYGYCTVIANTPIPLGTMATWSIKILRSERDDGRDIYVGAAPSDIDQNISNNHYNCGWYFYCYCSTLCSGPPHGSREKEYGPRKEDGEYVHTGDSVGVVMDTARGELSFALNGVDLGVAYEGIPLDKPLVPCVVLYKEDDSVELAF